MPLRNFKMRIKYLNQAPKATKEGGTILKTNFTWLNLCHRKIIKSDLGLEQHGINLHFQFKCTTFIPIVGTETKEILKSVYALAQVIIGPSS